MSEVPNILLITTHDLGTHLGCYGWDPALPTEDLDRLASEGVRFGNHFCTACFCSPSRGSIITGKYPHVNGLMGLVNMGWDIPGGNVFLPELLGRAGYDTSLFGLQHVAEDPTRLGYERVIGERGNRGCKTVVPLVVDYLTSRGKRADRPFFVEAGFMEVHRPYGGLEQVPVKEDEIRPLPWLEDTAGLRKDMAMFYENIRRTDRAVGELLAALDSLGLAENTLVIFTTDHGIAFPRAKATLYDPGIRTTLLMRWPAGFSGGRVASAMLSNVDLFPTLAEIVGQDPADDCNGESFLGVLRGARDEARSMVFAEKNTSWRDTKRCVRTAGHKYIRNYDEGPLLALPSDIGVSSTRKAMGDTHEAPRAEIELYDLSEDPWEQNNLAGDPAHRTVEADMAARLQRVLEETHDPILDGAVPRPKREAEISRGLWHAGSMGKREQREARLLAEYNRLKNEALPKP